MDIEPNTQELVLENLNQLSQEWGNLNAELHPWKIEILWVPGKPASYRILYENPSHFLSENCENYEDALHTLKNLWQGTIDQKKR